MKQFLFLCYFLTSIYSVRAQKPVVNEYASVDKKALLLPDSISASTGKIAAYINANFSSQTEKTRAIFVWLANNIQYDIANMFAIDFYEKKEDKIDKALKSKKGICEDYAAIFQEICAKTGIRSYVIDGYTKQNGFADYIPHAWCAAMIDDNWYIFDPTWGSGYMKDGKYFKQLNNNYFKVNPAVSIRSHMPFDYLWQFLPYPISNQSFYEGNTQLNKAQPLFSFSDSIAFYDRQDRMEQLKSAALRIEANGVKNAMIFDRLRNIKIEIENDRRNNIFAIYNAAAFDYNAGINAYNAFIDYRNKQFNPAKPDNDIQAMLTLAKTNLSAATAKLESIKAPDVDIQTMIGQLQLSVNDAEKNFKEQQDWLNVYFSKNKAKRKAMFYERKTTLFGVPIN